MTQSDYMMADIRKTLDAILTEIKKLNKTMSAKNGTESKAVFRERKRRGVSDGKNARRQEKLKTRDII